MENINRDKKTKFVCSICIQPGQAKFYSTNSKGNAKIFSLIAERGRRGGLKLL